MGDIPMGWATLIGALLTSAGGIVAIVMSVRTRSAVRQIGDDTAEVKEQVKNSHPTNLRVEQDDRHEAIMSSLRTIKATQTKHGAQIRNLQETQRGLKRDVGRLADADQAQVREDRKLGDRIRDLEHKPPHPEGDNTNV